MTYHVMITPRTLHFKQPAGTSRGVYTTRQSWFITITSPDAPDRKGMGECAPLPDLSCDAIPEYERILTSICNMFALTGKLNHDMLRPYPS
ncbi:MAG: o-succinylbenzoate synthase, partial [Prevotella sp.]|nr:o-succinylbenzoate synthase [Prevotella sp.]